MRRGEQAVEGAIEDAGTNEVSKLRKNLRMLYGVAGVSPMLGLLGTVWGMIKAFQVASVGGLGRAENPRLRHEDQEGPAPAFHDDPSCGGGLDRRRSCRPR